MLSKEEEEEEEESEEIIASPSAKLGLKLG